LDEKKNIGTPHVTKSPFLSKSKPKNSHACVPLILKITVNAQGSYASKDFHENHGEYKAQTLIILNFWGNF
jgi:hypothetical protein